MNDDTRLTIYGAGMAGLLAAQMMRHRSPLVREAKLGLPNNHGALLRFRTDRVSRLTSIPFRPVMVDKAVVWGGTIHRGVPPLAAQNEYAFKVSRSYTGRSIMNLDRGERWIAPADFVTQLARGTRIEYGAELSEVELSRRRSAGNALPIISTIPMPALAQMVEWHEPIHFQHWAIRTIRVLVQQPMVDLYQTIYFPEEVYDPYRVSITGNLITIETLLESTDVGPWTSTVIKGIVQQAQRWLGLRHISSEEINVHDQRYGKLLPLPATVRRGFILAMTERYGLYSVGRFATWRQLLLDDVAGDLETVEKLIQDRSMYSTRLQQARSLS